MIDCDVSKWVPDECTVSCVDKCPDKLNPRSSSLSREVTQFPTSLALNVQPSL